MVRKMLYIFVVSTLLFLFGENVNNIVGQFLESHSKTVPCNIQRAYYVKKIRTEYLMTGDKDKYLRLEQLYGELYVSQDELVVYDFIAGNQFHDKLGMGRTIGTLNLFSYWTNNDGAKLFVDSLREDLSIKGALTMDENFIYGLTSMKSEVVVFRNSRVVDSLINAFQKKQPQ